MKGGWMRVWRSLFTVVAIVFIAGCAHFSGATRPNSVEDARWEGRLRVKVQGPSPQSFSAAFALQGSAQHGSLMLYTPLGTTAAQVQWSANGAQMQADGQVRAFASLAELTRELTGTELPVPNLFAWLQGLDAPAPGWVVDLSQLPQGRLQASRQDALAPAELWVLLER